MSTRSFRAALFASVLLVCLAYANHWTNPFHFDDEHTIVQNPSIRSLANLPRLLTDATSASVYPTHTMYRPLTYVTLAVDYAVAGGLDPRVFHATTFIALLGVLATIFVLCRKVLDAAWPTTDNRGWALFAATLFGVHPVIADTVNYVIQRGELLAAWGMTGAVALYAAWPAGRRTGAFLLPGALGILAKPPAGMFPAGVGLYQIIVEGERQLRRLWPTAIAFVVSGVLMAISAKLSLAGGTFDSGAPPAAQYLWTQPWIALRYAWSFVLPLDLSIDPGWRPLASPVEWRALVGYTWIAVLLGVTVWLMRQRRTAPMAFGLAWSFIGLFPVAAIPLAEVTNDHRMFLPFIGLVIAAAGLGRLLAASGRVPARVMTAAMVVVLIAGAAATWQRNRAWSSHESIWRDAVAKNPGNGRARMNYGVALMQRGEYATALQQFEEAVIATPNYDFLEVNLGVVKDALGRKGEAEIHFRRAIDVSPRSNVGHLYYGRWLVAQQRVAEGVYYLERAVSLRPDDVTARHALLAALSTHRAFARLRQVATDTLARLPGDQASTVALATAERELAGLDAMKAAVRQAPTADGWLDLSLRLYNVGDFTGSIDAAREALGLRADYAEAYNNIAAAHNALGQWKEGVEAAQRALALRPDLVLARNNLAWAMSQLKQ